MSARLAHDGGSNPSPGTNTREEKKAVTGLDYEEIRRYIRESTPESVVMVGCDSVRKGKGEAVYSTVVVIRRASGSGKGVMYHGCKVFGAAVKLPDYGRVEKSGKIFNLKQRLLQEVALTLEAVENIYEAIGDRPFEIHVDINENDSYESSKALSEARGYVKGMTGIEPAFKPNALAASFAADAHAHGVFQ